MEYGNIQVVNYLKKKCSSCLVLALGYPDLSQYIPQITPINGKSCEFKLSFKLF